MIKNKLALVWEKDEVYIAHPLNEVSEELYKELSETFGRPVGRTEKYLNLTKFNEDKEQSEIEKLMGN